MLSSTKHRQSTFFPGYLTLNTQNHRFPQYRKELLSWMLTQFKSAGVNAAQEHESDTAKVCS